MPSSFSLDRALVDAIQVSATSRDQLAAAVVAARELSSADQRRAYLDAFQQHALLTAALALACRPDEVTPQDALAAANEVTLQLLQDQTVPDVASALPRAIATLWPSAS